MSRTANDDRSDSMNPNNDAYHGSQYNRANQLNPDHGAYHQSRDHGACQHSRNHGVDTGTDKKL